MFDKLFEFIWDIWEAATPVFAVKPYQGGIKIHYWPWPIGMKVQRIGPGLHWKVPLIGSWQYVTMAIDTMQIGPLSLVSKDGKEFVVVAAMQYCVKDPVPMCVSVGDELGALRGRASAALKRHTTRHVWSVLISAGEEMEKEILNDIRQKGANEWGFKLMTFEIVTLCDMKSFRILLDSEGSSAPLDE